jgi:hypothetical protein
MEPKRYVVTVALAASLGINGILAGAGLNEKEGVRRDVTKIAHKSPEQISGVQTALDGFASNEACTAIMSLPEPPASCGSDNIHSMIFSRRFIDNNGDMRARVEALVGGVNYSAYTETLSPARLSQLKNFAAGNFCADLMAEPPPTSTCAISNILEVHIYRRIPDLTAEGWSAKTEGVWQFTLSEGAPDT